MDFFFSLQCSSPSAERHFRFPVVVTGVTTFSAEQCPAAPEDDGPEKGRLSLSRPSGLLVVTMYLKYEVREVREKALSLVLLMSILGFDQRSGHFYFVTPFYTTP